MISNIFDYSVFEMSKSKHLQLLLKVRTNSGALLQTISYYFDRIQTLCLMLEIDSEETQLNNYRELLLCVIVLSKICNHDLSDLLTKSINVPTDTPELFKAVEFAINVIFTGIYRTQQIDLDLIFTVLPMIYQFIDREVTVERIFELINNAQILEAKFID